MPNIKAVAELAGVSASTVSRVINETGYVNEATRKKVLRAVEAVNYRPNALAKSLKEGRSNTLCLAVPTIRNLIFAEVARGVEDVARAGGFTVMLCNVDDNEDAERSVIETMKDRWADGFILCSRCGHGDHLLTLRRQGYPLVLANRFNAEDVGALDTVSVDNYRSAYEATGYLLSAGYRRIAIANGPEWMYLYRQRLEGYRQALRDRGIEPDPALEMHQQGGVDGFRELVRRVMSLPEPPDAIFADSDPKAFVVLHTLHEMGLSVPEDAGLLGFDDVELSSFMEPPLSTMSQPLYDLGAEAARSVIRQIRYKEENGRLPPPEQKLLPTRLVVRRSTGRRTGE